MRKSIVLLLAASVVLAAFGCSDLDPADPVGADRNIKAEDVTGNCLSFPVLWAEGVTVPLRGTFGETTFLGASTLVDGVEVFHQHDPLNEWQAQSVDVSSQPLHVDWIDWGDNIESRAWPDKSKIRVEVVLYQDLDTPLTGYEMIWVSGLGIDEMWGTNTLTYESTQATVYSHTARMTIQKLTADYDVADLTWDPAAAQWVGDVSEPFYNSAVFDEGESPIERYAAEINVKGKVIYGTLWDTRTHGDGPGIYRLTFSFDGVNAAVPVNAYFDEYTEILVPVEEELEKAEPVGGTTHIDIANNLTWVDLPITPTSGSGHNRPDNPGNGGGGQGAGGGSMGRGGGGRN